LTRARSSHQQKTWDEKRCYLETTVQQKLSPTVDERAQEIDSTETTAGGVEVTRSYQRTRSRKPRFAQLRENWLKAAVAIVVIPLASWILVQLYSLNREVGELRVHIDEMTKRQDELKGDMEKLSERVKQEMDRINDRLNGARPSIRP
jgi:cell division protein FtsL